MNLIFFFEKKEINEIICKNRQTNSNLIKYDAYVSYVDSDLSFVLELCNFLESPDINLKLYIRARDLLMGTLEYADFTELMAKQCNKLLVILSPDFCESIECHFQAKFTLNLQIEEQRRRLIPIIYKACKPSELPSFIKCFSKIDLTRSNSIPIWTWQKLITSLSNDLDGKTQFLPITNNSLPSLNSLSIHSINSSNLSNLSSNLSNGSSNSPANNTPIQNVNDSNSKKVKSIIQLEDSVRSSDKKSNDKSNILNSSSLTIKSLNQTYSTDDTHALIAKQRSFKFSISKIWKKINISSGLNKR